MSHLIVQVGPGAPTLLHFLRHESVANSVFDLEAERLSADHGVYHLRVARPLKVRVTREMAEALAREYGAGVRAGVLTITKSTLGPRYAHREGLQEVA